MFPNIVWALMLFNLQIPRSCCPGYGALFGFIDGFSERPQGNAVETDPFFPVLCPAVASASLSSIMCAKLGETIILCWVSSSFGSPLKKCLQAEYHRTHLTCLTPLRNHRPGLHLVQCLKMSASYILFSFLYFMMGARSHPSYLTVVEADMHYRL